MIDRYKRQLNYMRISVTDCCNLACIYCMPPNNCAHDKTAEISDLLTLDEIFMVAEAAAERGVERIRITGGEPLLRPGVTKLLERIRHIPGIKKTALTTNGTLLEKYAEQLADAGLDSVSISLDTLRCDRYKKITGSSAIDNVLRGIEAAMNWGIPSVKINTVLVDGYNDDEAEEIAMLAMKNPLSIRFIELMPVGPGEKYRGLNGDLVRERLENRFGRSLPVHCKKAFDVETEKRTDAAGPAGYITFRGFRGKIGFISPLSHNFCKDCNRIRLTSDGRLRLCLGHECGIDLKQMIRSGADKKQLGDAIENAAWNKPFSHEFSDKEKEKEEDKGISMFRIGG